MLFNIVILLFFSISIFLLTRRYINLNNEATTISGVLTSLNIYLCLIPLVVIAFGDDYTFKYYFSCLTLDLDSFIPCYFGIFIFILFLTLSYEWGLHTNHIVRLDIYRLEVLSKRLGYATLLIGAVSFIAYANSFGGIATLLLKAEYMRSFATNKADLVDGRAYILVIPARLITVSPYLLWFARSQMKNKIWNSLLIIISIVLSCLFYLSNAGKTDVLIFGLSFFVPMLSYRFKHKWFITISIAILSLSLVTYLDALFVYLGTGEFVLNDEDGNLACLSQFVYPIRNVLNLDNILSSHSYRWGQDFITGLLNIIPGVNFEPSYQPTSEFFGGKDWKIGGGVPNDAITFGYLQFGFIGIAIVGMLIGYICAKIDICFKQLSDSFADRVIKCTLIILYFIMFINADVISVVRNQFTLTILSGWLLAARVKDHNLLPKISKTKSK